VVARISQPDPAALPLSTPQAGDVPNGPLTTPTDGPSPAPPAVQRFDRYELLEEVAQGGMGVVYRARDTVLGRTVALKMMRAGLFAGADEVARFHREAQAIAQLDHPGTIKIFEVGQADGQHFFTMPFAAGGSLTRYRARDDVGPGAIVPLVEKIARAVQHAHEHGILHRDLKPGNVLLDDRGEPLVADFGLAKFLAADVELTQTGQRPGTPAYMAPEQLAEPAGPVTAQTDVWALGVMLYELLAGRRPFGGGSREALTRAILTSEPPRLGHLEVDRTLEGIVRKCLAKEPRQRYPSAAALADDLRRWSEGWRLPAERWPARAWRALWRPRTLLLTALMAAVVAGLLPFALPKSSPGEVGEEPALTLIASSGGPPEVVWRMGQETTDTALDGPEAVFSAVSRRTAILELCPSPPWPHYRFEAEVRHDDSLGDSAVGLCFGYQEVVGDTGVQRGFCHLSFADRGDRGRGRGHVTLWMERDRPPAPGRSANRGVILGNKNNGLGHPIVGPGPWRRLAIEVTGETLRAFWEGEMIREVVRDEWLREGALLSMDYPALPPTAFPPAGGLGLYLKQGKASFRQVLVKPLPERGPPSP
jgi:hypothetical protein